jgi:hypothetical protein
MAGAATGILVLGLVVTVGGGLLLYVLVGAENAGRPEYSREEAERVARRDTDEER